MSKASTEFNQQIVKEYLNGTLGYHLLVKKYQILSTSPTKALDNINRMEKVN